jgi:hypothetical protein
VSPTQLFLPRHAMFTTVGIRAQSMVKAVKTGASIFTHLLRGSDVLRSSTHNEEKGQGYLRAALAHARDHPVKARLSRDSLSAG